MMSAAWHELFNDFIDSFTKAMFEIIQNHDSTAFPPGVRLLKVSDFKEDMKKLPVGQKVIFCWRVFDYWKLNEKGYKLPTVKPHAKQNLSRFEPPKFTRRLFQLHEQVDKLNQECGHNKFKKMLANVASRMKDTPDLGLDEPHEFKKEPLYLLDHTHS